MASLDFDIMMEDYDTVGVQHIGDGCIALMQETDVPQWQGVERIVLSVNHLVEIMRRYGPTFGFELKNTDHPFGAIVLPTPIPNSFGQFLER